MSPCFEFVQHLCFFPLFFFVLHRIGLLTDDQAIGQTKVDRLDVVPEKPVLLFEPAEPGPCRGDAALWQADVDAIVEA